ncbi:SCY1-like protein 2 [Amborella trichopoda]|uniref:Protein kinase domain-containing protein n=1 Tax=Amborella trichopoda TaxID=13333 RepID=W1Q0G4_AMBTC|nr:SCY1-like protein 2 [Amborella trichopoda]ERN13896.1 hypothetical protein AMTR_s00021p00078920 [Amborella trichopoda]|eukprot:XP_006852429.1 SCY1-like protein 2 [Amborella trichopoda]
MSLNMKTLTQALAKTAAVIEKTVQTTVQEVTGPKALQDYELLDQVGSGGHGHVWKLYSARPRTKTLQSQYPLVCIWLLDKKAVSEARIRAGLSKAAEDAFMELVKADASRLVRLRHPGVVHVVQGLDETKNSMAMVTEPIFASVANVLGVFDNIGSVPKELKGLEMGVLEIKHGLLQITESIDFLHNNARLIHRAISPEAVFITSNGAWKLGAFGFTIPADQNPGDLSTVQPFHYPEYDVDDLVMPLQPSLDYSAPELVRSQAGLAGCLSDIFSLGCLIYHLLVRKPLLDCKNNVRMYTNKLTYLLHESFSNISSDLVNDLRRMLSVDEASRPSALDFTGSPFFRDDTRLRALRFLDHMLERDNMQKSDFLKALSGMWKDFDSRVLRYKVLPPLCSELRNIVMQPMILPMVLTIAESQDKNDFENSTLPALVPVLSSAAGETLLLLVKHAELIISKTGHEHLVTHVLPLLVRAYDDTDARIQEEVLRRTISLAKQLDVQLVKQAILPRLHGLALKTTVAAVRVNALLCLGDLVHLLDKPATVGILQTLQRCTAVDRSAPTLMCTLGVTNSIYKKYGIDFAAEHILPLLIPLLLAQQLNVQQFAKYMLFVKDILRKIEEQRGVAVTELGVSQMGAKTFAANGSLAQPIETKPNTDNSSSIKLGSSAWDEDWPSIVKGPSASQPPQINNPSFNSRPLTPTPWPSMPTPPNTQNSPSCPPVDIEWPPSTASTSYEFSTSESEKPKTNPTGALDNHTLEDLDPFANWPPPRSSSQKQGLGTSNVKGITFATSNTIGFPKENQGSLGNMPMNTDSYLGLPYKNQGAVFDIGGSNNFVGSFADKKEADVGSIFVSPKNEQTPLRIAPPPPSGKGRGRGRSQVSVPSRPRHTQSPTEQPSLMDLL